MLKVSTVAILVEGYGCWWSRSHLCILAALFVEDTPLDVAIHSHVVRRFHQARDK
jgi:hypothetical protein